MKKKFAVIFTVPVEVQVADGAVPDINEVIKALTNAAYDKLQARNYKPHIEELHEVISEDENGSNPGTRYQHQRGQARIRVRPTGREDADYLEDLRMDEQRQSERDVSGETGQGGGEGKDRKEDERGLHFDKTG
jgi:hypothetical protein